MKYKTNKVISILASVLITVLIIIGLWLDMQQTLTQEQLKFSFYTSAIFGLLVTNVFFLLRYKSLLKKLIIIIVALIVWRISYFPIMVLAGFLATLGEAFTITLFNKSVVYPFLLLSIALINAFSMLIAGSFLFLLLNINQKEKPLQQSKLSSLIFVSQASIVTAISVPLAVLAIGVSFTQPADWHAIPDTSILDDKPLPTASLPEINPYATAFEKQGLSWKHLVLFKAAEITYNLIPENTRWSQIVKGTLEKEFIETTEVSTAFCTKVHLRAFMTAQPFLNGNKSIHDL